MNIRAMIQNNVEMSIVEKQDKTKEIIDYSCKGGRWITKV
jgi:hypothetical protein